MSGEHADRMCGMFSLSSRLSKHDIDRIKETEVFAGRQ